MLELTEGNARTVLDAVRHPAGQAGIVTLGLVDHLTVEVAPPSIRFTLKPYGKSDPFLRSMRKRSLALLQNHWSGVEVTIGGVDAPSASATAGTDSASADAAGQGKRQGGIGRVKHVVAIASGKGGVGKSTVTANLAVTLARKGYSVGILDADVFGPSQPKMLGVEDAHPEVQHVEGEDVILPVEVLSLKMLSMGFFVSPDEALIWRGPMASNALKQLIENALWGELDYLLLDLPPGTSDIHLTVVQHIGLTGAVIVSTPQSVALVDAAKAVQMFCSEDVHVPILGVVENMAWFEPAEFPGNRYYLFGKEGAMRFAAERKLPFLGQLPLIQAVREGGDQGCPIASSSGPMSEHFERLADNFLEEVAHRMETLPPPEPVHTHN